MTICRVYVVTCIYRLGFAAQTSWDGDVLHSYETTSLMVNIYIVAVEHNAVP